MKKTMMFLLAVVFFGCSTQKQDELKEVGPPAADPGKVPTEIALYRPAPVIAARFEVSDSGYALRAFRALGAPSASIDQNRDVVVRALDVQGNLLSTISLDNPREVHTTGADNPGRAIRAQASFTVFFQNPDAIRQIEVTVLRGANAGFKRSFAVNPRELPPLEENEIEQQ